MLLLAKSFLSFLAAMHANAATPESLLKGIWKDPQLQAQQQVAEIATDASGWNPINETQLTVERPDTNKTELQYGIALSPKGYSEIKTSKQYKSALEKDVKAQGDLTVSRLLGDRYLILAKAALVKAKHAFSRDLAEMAKRAGKAFSLSARQSQSEVKSYLKARSDLEKVEQKVEQIDREYADQESDLKQMGLTDLASLDLTDLVEADEIQKRLPEKINEQTVTLSGRIAQTDAERARMAVAYDRAQTSRWIDKVEVKMKDDKTEKVYGVELTLNVPFLSADDLGDIDKRVKEIRSQAMAADVAKSSQSALQKTVSELKSLLGLHATLSKSSMTREQMRKASQALAARDPLLSIEMQRSWFESREQRLDLEYRIRELFVVYLQESLTLAQDPETNHLSKTLRKIL